MIKNWFQGLGMPIVALHLLALSGISGFAAVAVFGGNMLLLARCSFALFFSVVALWCLLCGTAATLVAFQEYTIWLRLDQQVTVRWLSGIFCYGYDDLETVEVADHVMPWGPGTARERTFKLQFRDKRVAVVTLKGAMLKKLLKAIHEHNFHIEWDEDLEP